MRRTLTSTLAAAALSAALSVAGLAGATSAAAMTTPPADGSFTVSVADVTLSPGCKTYPATYTVEVQGAWTLYVRPYGPRGGQPQYLTGQGRVTGSADFQLCDWMGAGTYSVSAQLGWTDGTGQERVSYTETAFAVLKATSRITAVPTARTTRATGTRTPGPAVIRVTGSSAYNAGQGWQRLAGGTVTVQYKPAGARQWLTARVIATPSTGAYDVSWTVRKAGPVSVRAVLTSSDVAAGSVSRVLKVAAR